MIKNAVKMPYAFYIFLLCFLSYIKCELRLTISEYVEDEIAQPLGSIVELTAGTNTYLECTIGGYGSFSSPDLRWGRKTKDLKFRNESDLVNLAENRSKQLYDLQNTTADGYYYYYYYSESAKSVRRFTPVKVTDRGAHFCMSLKYMLFKIIHIKVKETQYLDTSKIGAECNPNKFRCVSSGFCINLHYKCDGRHDCKDGSDENRTMCNGNPCWNKIRCRDGRCIPRSWCCDKHTDDSCNVTIRPSCCPPLQNPFDPLLWYNGNATTAEPGKSSGSKYLFITICVVSALLSFVLFIFIISKICGFDSKPSQTRNTNLSPIDCDHSECALRRQFSANVTCLYRRDANVTTDNNNELADSLVLLTNGSASDQPPSYSEVINTPFTIDKSTLDDLFNAPPPPYSSTKCVETEYQTNTSHQNL